MDRPGPRVLVVEGERETRRFLRTILRVQGYRVFEAAAPAAVHMTAPIIRPDVIILDVSLPNGDYIVAIRGLRESVKRPILILSSTGEESEKIAALDAGADDYLTRPFGVGEFLARLRVMIRHVAGIETVEPFRIGELEIDLARRLVTVGGKTVHPTPTEYDLLKVLVTAAGKVLTHQQLLQQVWGHGYEGEFHLLRVTISHLRQKLRRDHAHPEYILTETGVGYYLRANG